MNVLIETMCSVTLTQVHTLKVKVTQDK